MRPKKNKKTIKGIKAGDNTQNQDQAMYPVNFKVMKIKVKIGRKGNWATYLVFISSHPHIVQERYSPSHLGFQVPSTK